MRIYDVYFADDADRPVKAGLVYADHDEEEYWLAKEIYPWIGHRRIWVLLANKLR